MNNILITGANRGLGLEFTKQYAAEEQNRIWACCRHPENAEELKKIASATGRVKVYSLDVANFTQMEKLSAELKDEAIDILINNAGLYGKKLAGFGHSDYREWATIFQVNTMAPMKMAECFVEQIKRSGKKTIVIITSKMGSISDNTSGGCYPYRSTKSAVNMVGKSLALDLKSEAITVLLLHPGWVLTDMGGPNALITPQESITGMRQVIERATPADSGKFFAYDGQEIGW